MDLPQIPRTSVTVNDATYGHKNDMFSLRDIFALKKTGASWSKCRHVFLTFQAGNQEPNSFVSTQALMGVAPRISHRNMRSLHNRVRYKNHHIFNIRCHDEGMIPFSLRI